MRYSKEKIFNITLKNLGITVPVGSENSADKNRNVLEEYYDTAYGQVVNSADWIFANCYRTLTLLKEKPLNPNYKYAYDYPNDVGKSRELVRLRESDVEYFEVAIVNNSQQLWCNKEQAVLRYTKKLTNAEELMDEDFAMALSWYLAFLCCNSLSGARVKQSDCLTIYQQQLKSAQTVNANADKRINDENCSWLDARN